MDDFICIATLDSPAEAQLLQDSLATRKIPFRLEPFGQDELASGKGWGSVSAPSAHSKTIIYLLSEQRKNASRLGR